MSRRTAPRVLEVAVSRAGAPPQRRGSAAARARACLVDQFETAALLARVVRRGGLRARRSEHTSAPRRQLPISRNAGLWPVGRTAADDVPTSPLAGTGEMRTANELTGVAREPLRDAQLRSCDSAAGPTWSSRAFSRSGRTPRGVRRNRAGVRLLTNR